MRGQELVMFLYSDLSGLCRGRAFPVEDLEERLEVGVGWVPADQAITVFGPIAEPNQWGPIGDLRLLPDRDTQVRVDLWPDASPLHFFICEAAHTDGSPWDACPRVFLRRALEDFRAQTGLQVLSAFEQEFAIQGLDRAVGPGFSMEAFRALDPIGPLIMAALGDAKQQPEMFLPEFGPNQYEVTCRPAIGVAGADRAVIIREVVREVVRRAGLRATFAPILNPDSVGNGVHIHISLVGEDGKWAVHDPQQPGEVSEVAGQFAAGVIRHLPALCALTAPSTVSYARLTPHRWSAAYTAFGVRNREAAVRVSPTVTIGGRDPSTQSNLEYRPADAAASPHLALGAVVRAGLQGITEALPTPPMVNRDPAELSDAEREKLGVHRLPTSLEEALKALEGDEIVRSWFPDELWDCYLTLKRTEIELVHHLDVSDACARYADVY
jgi:glutamine synthetase